MGGVVGVRGGGGWETLQAVAVLALVALHLQRFPLGCATLKRQKPEDA